ncbi:MAG TPA: cation-translocating P-type ATPase [Flavisolibacter sp.]
MNWHHLDIERIYSLLGTSQEGLSGQLVEQRLDECGPNELEEKKKKPAWVLLLNQFKDFMIIVLMAAAVISGIVGDSADTIIIMVIVVLNAVVGFIQEYRAEKAMEALRKMATPQTTVMRNGHAQTIPSSELVPGDVVVLDAGNTVPADLRLFESKALRVVEASLTGESVPVDKTTEAITEQDLPIGDRFNMAYKGTQVTNGRGKGIVVATGMNTEIGQIARMLQEKETITPLQKRMADFGKKLSYLILGICVVLFGVGLLRGEEPLGMLLIAISLAVAAIPEALPALITVALSRGAKRLVKKNVLIRKLHAVETLGSVTYICSDKTGTLTLNKMTVVEVKPDGNAPQLDQELSALEIAMILNNDVRRQRDGNFTGDPTEIAVVDHIYKQHSVDAYNRVQQQFPRVAELPFDSDRKCMTTIHRLDNRYIAFSKGAVETIVAVLATSDHGEAIHQDAEQMASNGIRVLGYGFRVLDHLEEPFRYEDIEKDLLFAGLVGMIDPPRKEIPAAIKECRTAGIHPVMITGDHKETAAAIAREIGIIRTDELVVTGTELARMDREQFDQQVERIAVYARVSPEQKLNIVKALQRKNHFVAMTGDGVNDAPSLKKSNIGIAMGITGTDVSKEASHMILLDDNFATIIKAVREGRRIYDNIRKFVKYIMTCNSAEIWTIFMAPLLGLPIPLLPIHILWINLVTDGLPGLALSAEKAEKNIMRRPPRRTDESLFSEGIGVHIVWVGILMAGVTLATQAWALQRDNTHWQTMVFTVLSLAQLAHVLAIRSEHEFIYRKGFFSNPLLLGSVFFTFLLQLAVIYLPFANKIFKTQPLTMAELAICIGVSVLVFHAVEFEKMVKKFMLERRSGQSRR